jgi:hypothetical protein
MPIPDRQSDWEKVMDSGAKEAAVVIEEAAAHTR